MADNGDLGSAEESSAATRPVDHNVKPTWAQIRYLIRGLNEPGGKLPLFDDEGQEIDLRTIRSCVVRGWAEPWFANPVKPDWLICKLTPSGYKILGTTRPQGS